ncbi:MAG TPA: hypothetical protein VIG51_13415 [Candidatus Baltobacteraceae bacterium]|jgi:integrase
MSVREDSVSPLYRALRDQSQIYDAAGNAVLMEGEAWRLYGVARSVVLTWTRFAALPSEIAQSLVAFMRFNVETKSHDHCRNVFSELSRLFENIERYKSPGMRALLLARLAALRDAGSEWKFHYSRDWFRWSADQGFAAFEDAELLYELLALRIPGNTKGEAVLSEDPDEGPIDDLEEIALRAALHRDTDNLLARALTWAFLALGCNPKNLVYLCEGDLRHVIHGEHDFYSLDMPRIKKGVEPRAVLKPRKLDGFLARLFNELIERNARLDIPEGFSRPLFCRLTPRPDCVGTTIERFAYHFTTKDLLSMVKEYVISLGVVSHRTSKPLHVTPRRLRYRFATKKVQEGCPMEILKDLLDHSDLQNVMVYYSGASMTERLDEALAVTVGPIVNRFMGRVVSGEIDATDGGGRVACSRYRLTLFGDSGLTESSSLRINHWRSWNIGHQKRSVLEQRAPRKRLGLIRSARTSSFYRTPVNWESRASSSRQIRIGS